MLDWVSTTPGPRGRRSFAGGGRACQRREPVGDGGGMPGSARTWMVFDGRRWTKPLTSRPPLRSLRRCSPKVAQFSSLADTAFGTVPSRASNHPRARTPHLTLGVFLPGLTCPSSRRAERYGAKVARNGLIGRDLLTGSKARRDDRAAQRVSGPGRLRSALRGVPQGSFRGARQLAARRDRKSTRLNSSHLGI